MEECLRVGGDGLRDGAVHRLQLVVQRHLRLHRPLLHAVVADRLWLRQGFRVLDGNLWSICVHGG